MKRLLLVLITLLACMSTRAQQFNGVELSGNRKEFTSSYLKSRTAASVVYRVENETAIKDKFLNYPVTLYIQRYAGSNTDDVWSIWFDIIFPKSADWASMVKRYEEVLEYLTKQYGEPHPWLKSREFEYPYSGDNHIGKELTALKYGKCKYSDIFIFGSWKLIMSFQYVDDVVNNTSYYSIMVSILPAR